MRCLKLATETTNYKLKKPAQEDFYNIDDHNTNMDIIDAALITKVDKIDGKSLSTNDYTTDEKDKVATIPTITDKITALETNVGTITTSGSTLYINSAGGRVYIGTTGSGISIEDTTITAETLNGTATRATALTSTSVGSSINPVYFNSAGKPVACDYSFNQATNTTAGITKLSADDAIDLNQTQADTAVSVNAFAATMKKIILDTLCPIGKWWISGDPTDPGKLVGGTWERIKGKFILAADDSTYKAGDTGGEAEHVLTVDEMPNHTHRFQLNYDSDPGYLPKGSNPQAISAGKSISSSSPINGVFTDRKGPWSQIRAMEQTGGGKAHNNLPPYLAVYVWRRTA